MPRPPSNGAVTSPYGPRQLQVPGVGPFHYGEDTVGEGNVAPASGTVVFAGYSGVFGNIILVRESANPAVAWNIAHHEHLNGRRPGQRVAEGEFLAPKGATGLATGPHAHTERRVGGRDAIQSGTHTNPRDHYTAPAPAGGKGTPLPTVAAPESEEDEMNVVLYLYVPSNTLLLVDHLNKTIRNLGNSAGSAVRDHFSRKPYTKAFDTGDARIKAREGVSWQETVDGYVYITTPNVEGTPAVIDATAVAAQVASALAGKGVTAPTAAEIAKAVNDDAARRLQS